MNEEFIRRAIQIKFDIAGKILGRLPENTAKKIREYRDFIYESIGENLSREDKKEVNKKICNVKIE